ncbi:LytR C-terminal domain-containing protein [Streptomyces sp. NPDC001480]|uniref:LytR C-terminal domain-containing protein n=1 Tax=Streptomyces sp. NPDC001480 TaxID=3364577 RepID=UPI003673CDD5
MSMLTPPGMGGQYRITGGKYPRMRPPRRRGRLVFLTFVCVTALGVAGWGTVQLIDVFTGGGDKDTVSGAKAKCPATTKVSPAARTEQLPAPGKITVNVYNATARTGLAKHTADELKKRGFRIGDVGNATKQYDKKIKGTGMLLGPASALNTSLPVLAAQLAGAEQRTDATRKGDAVDLIIGNGFKDLSKRADADKAVAELTTPVASTVKKKDC